MSLRDPMNAEGIEVTPPTPCTVPNNVGDTSVVGSAEGSRVGSRLGSSVSCDAEGITPRISPTPSPIGVKSCDVLVLFFAAAPMAITISMTTAPTRRAADSSRTNWMRGGASANHVGNDTKRPFSFFDLLVACLSMEASGDDSSLRGLSFLALTSASRVERRLIISIPSEPDGGSGASPPNLTPFSLPKCKLGDAPLSLSTTEA